MKNLENIIEKYLTSKYKLNGNQLQYELKRFENYPDVGRELSQALKKGRFPKETTIFVCIENKHYSAKNLYKLHYAKTIYAAYSLLTQLIENPKLFNVIKEGFKIK